jgi:2-polyprenyl-6-methoxyphenol hydroxylase-like FAD-dependent oxidoreductase
MVNDHYDAIIVGAGAAGAATAFQLAGAGRQVLLVDGTENHPSVSVRGLDERGLDRLDRWGVLHAVRSTGAPPIDGDGVRMAPRARVLDQVLRDAAIDAGATVRLGVTVDHVVHDSMGRVVGISGRDHEGRRLAPRAPVTIGADGPDSRLARAVAAATTCSEMASVGVAFGYWAGLDVVPRDEHHAAGGRLGVLPTNHDLTAVFVTAGPARFRGEMRRRPAESFCALVGELDPELAERLGRAERLGPVRAYLSAPVHVRQSFGRGWALVGEAGRHTDPTGVHGINDVLADAELLARTIVEAPTLEPAAALADYQHQRDHRAELAAA